MLTEYADRDRKMFPHCSSSPILTVAQAAGIDWLDEDKKRNEPKD